MAIKVTDEHDVHVTASELARYTADYNRDYAFYAGTPPTLNEYIWRRQNQRPMKDRVKVQNG